MILNESKTKTYFAFYALAAAVIFFAAMFIFTGYHLSAPLDDAFIYFQYAKNTAHGHFFEYVKGEGYSSGATSFLYAFILVPFAVFLKGSWLIIVTYFIGGISLFLSALYLYKSVKILIKNEAFAFFAALLFVTNGNILWGYFSGMEIAPFAALLIISFYCLLNPAKTAAQVISLSLLALIRPEGYALVILLFMLKVISRIFNKEEKVIVFIIPLAAGFTYFLTNYIFTGDFMPNTMRSKSNFSLYFFHYTEMIAQGWRLYFDFLKNIFNGETEHYFMRYSYFFFLLGVLPGVFYELKKKKPGPFIIGFVWFFMGVMSTVFSSFATVHNYRYTMPFVIIFVPFFTIGLYYVFERLNFANAKTKSYFLTAILSLFLFFDAFTIFANIINFGRDCRDIYSQSISAGKWLKENIKEDATIAINDAGAIAYYSEKKVYDLVGLVTNGQAIVFRNDKPSVFEEIENIRPDYFMIHVGWFNYEKYTLFGPRLTEFNIKREPAYFVVGSPEVCVPLDAALLGSGDTMKEDHTENGLYKEVDKIDIADLKSEGAHDFKIWVKYVSEMPGVMMYEEKHMNEGEMIFDAGRITSGGEQFKIKNLKPGLPVKIVKRSKDNPENVMKVTVNGKDAGEWTIEENKYFNESEFIIPGNMITGNEAVVKLEVKSKNRYNTFYYWFLQKERDT